MNVQIQPNVTTGSFTVCLSDELGNQSQHASFFSFWDAYAYGKELVAKNAGVSYIIQVF